MSVTQAALGLPLSPFRRTVQGFPSARLPSPHGGLPIEVSLIAQLGHGAGSQLLAGVMARQSKHDTYRDELDEPSARIGDTDFSKGDATALYTFTVGAKGHPFHRHAGHRVFTAVSGSGGTRLRFSTASDAEIERDPARFIEAMRCVEIPPDCLFTVRFGGGTWHQFTPLRERSRHPALFAISCHTNELGGDLPDALKQQVLANHGTLHALTELPPFNVTELVRHTPLDQLPIPTIALSLDAPAGTWQSRLCAAARHVLGGLRGYAARLQSSRGYRWSNELTAVALAVAPAGSLLHQQMNDGPIHHEDHCLIDLVDPALARLGSTRLLAGLLEAFVQSPPVSVSFLMQLRNLLVKPLGLRTSPLGCPVSSLLSPPCANMFADRFPVREQASDARDADSQVVLGANDKHLLFRSCVGVAINGDRIGFTLGTRVRCTNPFGHIYMGLIEHVHRRYITPTLLRQAIEHLREHESVRPRP
ncbi:DUF2867 domain-containing protein [Dyella flagellata]|uniref:DUF2867 domain-containing protein n=1 Tax=Dyella flagellata TaxID=1867833 RepID=A0ABQ5XCS0_9GAMM|nr:DUF2867 domain-containing protein [Dyella flagellata]GLQ89500.1 hypothetical protein GCM10007898_30740 [Dyella flagellata]